MKNLSPTEQAEYARLSEKLAALGHQSNAILDELEVVKQARTARIATESYDKKNAIVKKRAANKAKREAKREDVVTLKFQRAIFNAEREAELVTNREAKQVASAELKALRKQEDAEAHEIKLAVNRQAKIDRAANGKVGRKL
jgi:hypothetical protein